MLGRIATAFLMLTVQPLIAEDIVAARYADPTTRYDHGILGDAVEYGALVVRTAGGRSIRLVLPQTRVFEDVEPRLADVDGDGAREAIVVETDLERGARLAIYNTDGLIASTEYIGRTHRWLAPVGIAAADLDGDGSVELAYVDRPHLAKTLRIFRFRPGRLAHVADFPGVTNHRIGETDIAGGIRNCGEHPEIVLADAEWRRVLAVRFDGRKFFTRDIGPHDGRRSFAKALACDD